MENLKKFLSMFFIIGAFFMILNCTSSDSSSDPDPDPDPDPEETVYSVQFTVDGTTYTYTKGVTATEDAKCEYDAGQQEFKIVASLNGLTDGNINNDTTPDSVFITLETALDLSTITGTFELETPVADSDYLYFTLTNDEHFNTDDNVDPAINVTITENTDDYIKGTFSGTIQCDIGGQNFTVGDPYTVSEGTFTAKKSQ